MAILSPNAVTVAVAVHPSCVARVNPYTSDIKPTVIKTAPGRSRCLSFASSMCAGTYFRIKKIAKIPIGTLTKKHDRQPRYWVNTPPRKTPAAPPPEATILQIESVLLRACPSSNVVSKIDNAVGAINAAASPCNARKTINIVLVDEKPIKRENTEKPAIPQTSTRRLP